ncbi:N-acetylglucosamine-6-phosphate deacetylase [Flavonifractor sp. An10]|uniref:N-acetylglucosamine-6-phosphate deacetylase n=1 Tax=Flavonifractor sp. An10 TaxID=1965537 RepID=UPI000B3839DE|nr:N-acetylglucosamine-6-phosphate deacetylase [Flavonifractor sp. An10]OUQ83761.1 N-acetylglucosamine-6-phosphate deacetylase [Flavonifractor sp. An10]HJB71154.1 N-acetylglucosamine-6-phosphate deacetylase [Candidatus Flavonifractor avistercoris]
MRITGGQVFDLHEGFVRRDVCFDGRLLSSSSADGKTYDASGCYVIPGLTDLHFHGCMGKDFSDADPEGLEIMARYELSQGVTQICPAGMTLLEEQLTKVCQVAAAHRDANKPGAELCGINLEGPFLSTAKKGAQKADWIHAPDVDMFRRLMAASKGLVKLVSIAPEEPGAMEFIEAVEGEVTVSIAHTTADYDTAMEAFRLGARQVTHLFNAMPPFSHRAPGVVGAALDTPICNVELICDGVHIHPSVVRATFKMFGPKRVILVSDTMRAAGMPDGDYTLGGQPVKVKGKYATLADGTLAGSVTNLMNCMRTAVSFGIPLEDAVWAAAVNPARAIGIFSRMGSLEPGKRANVVVLDQNLELKDVFFRGELVDRG